MFPLNNVRAYGLDGDEPLSPRMWIARDARGTICDVLTITKAGMVMPRLASGDFAAAAAALRGRLILGVIGPTPDVRGLVAAIGLGAAATTINDDQPHFLLDLGDLLIPEGAGQLHTLGAADPQIMTDWRVAYAVEALHLSAARAAEDGRLAYTSYLARDSHRVLVAAGRPLATTGFNARLPAIVQVGGVYTPPALRGQGHARRAVALHLAEARAAGVKRATLFAASETAARTYTSIGFRRIGLWGMVLFEKPELVRG